jgi:DNA invertase Pin-like site-specific DNA recombinase
MRVRQPVSGALRLRGCSTPGRARRVHAVRSTAARRPAVVVGLRRRAAVSDSGGSDTVQVMRVVAYLRVSSAGQVDAWGLDRQEDAIKTYAKNNGHKIIDWCRDEGLSGTLEAVERPGLLAAIDMVPNRADGIIIADLDRFARKLTVQETALAVVWRAGGRVLTATSGEIHKEDPEDPSRNLIRQVQGAVIEYEKNMAVKRMRDGRRAKAATGKKSTGQYAFGYHRVGEGRDKDAGVNPERYPVVELIKDLRTNKHSYREICDYLNARGYLTKRGRKWLPMTVKRIYEREGAA